MCLTFLLLGAIIVLMFGKNRLNRGELSLTTRPLFGKIILFALPLMLSGILQLLYNATDIIVLGQYGSDASAGAVGSTTALITLMTNIFIGLSVGASSAAARWIGSGNQERLEKVAHTSICVALISGIVIGIVGVTCSKYFLMWMNVPENVLPLSTEYLRILFVAMPFGFVYNFASALLRAQGDTRHPLLFLFLAGIINVSLNLIFVIVCKMDVAGVALGTVCAQAVAATLSVVYLIKHNGPCKLYIKKLKVDKEALIEIIKIGLPAGIEGSIFSISNVVIQSAINSFGDLVLTANTEAASIEGFIYVSMNSVSQACLTATSQNYGACKSNNIDRAVISSLVITTTIGLVMGLTAYFACDYIMLLFTNNPEIIAIAKERLLAIATSYCLCGIMEIVVAMMRGMGHSFAPMIVSLVGVCGFRIIYVYTVFKAYNTLLVLYLSYPISWLITTIVHSIFLIFVRKKEYKKIDEVMHSADKISAGTSAV